VCHGSFAEAADWMPFGHLLAQDHTVYLYDRRGRGATPRLSSEAAIDAEVADLAAVMDAAGERAALLGHSFGGGCALAYAAREGFSGPVVVYEPRHAIDGPVSRGRAAAVDEALATDGPGAALHLVLAQIIGLPESDIRGFTASPLGARMRETIGAFTAEVRFLDTLKWQPGDLDSIAGPTWLLVGQETRVLDADREGALRSVLPRLRKVVLPGLGHFGYATAPQVLAEAVRDCLADTTAPLGEAVRR
jgi:pimeloyl-ACP methyl ester carboxylesterase